MRGDALSLSRDAGTVETTTEGEKDEETSSLLNKIRLLSQLSGQREKNPFN